MTLREIFDFGVGGSKDLKKIIEVLDANSDYCLIGGMALNCYVDPVYTADADFALAVKDIDAVKAALLAAGMEIKENKHNLSVYSPGSKLIVHITTDEQYQQFPARAESKCLFDDEISVKVASLVDLTQGKIWAFQDSCRRLTKRTKDRLDLQRIGINYPDLMPLLPEAIQQEIKIDAEHDLSM